MPCDDCKKCKMCKTCNRCIRIPLIPGHNDFGNKVKGGIFCMLVADESMKWCECKR